MKAALGGAGITLAGLLMLANVYWLGPLIARRVQRKVVERGGPLIPLEQILHGTRRARLERKVSRYVGTMFAALGLVIIANAAI
jgi:hypothetical protein